eukprot:CAMPEP_0173269114 /NCGR_PEP_ID=MMETSP1142-20121109/30703_1 /TAXON_ID=483371 /ORGANISM="non described non described, Strain CCMP2298" /LENGTH=873 /DNA_ID=CAMNT_0014205433 /DNA_START=275 /DNA_END=2895 /DNA_ORIENTATION=-
MTSSQRDNDEQFADDGRGGPQASSLPSNSNVRDQRDQEHSAGESGLAALKDVRDEGSDVFEAIKDSKTKRCYFHTGLEKDGFFYPLHVAACEINAIRSILQVNRDLLHSKMYGYEGSDVFEAIKDSKTKRCYFHTGLEKDGFFYPLHVAAEAGHKSLTILLVRAGADVNLPDYRGCVAEERCTGDAYHAFFELQGLKFEAAERYQGRTDRAGNRTGQGVLFFKPDGYEMEEMQLYRGSFKNDMYHGHGTLYWPGTDKIQYIGRFKAGMKHGRGIEFDEQGRKIYHGIFKEDKREGRGDEFSDEAKTYKGEFSDNVRHGFGVAYFGESAKYFGRYEGGMMCGVGIYCHPNGDRFEGMFFNNRPDGPGSFYELDHYTGNSTGSHAIWQAGRKVKDSNFPFVPTSADLPDYDGKEKLSEIINYAVSGGDEDAALAAIAAASAAAVGASDNSHDLGKINEDDEGDEDSPPKPVKTSAGAGVGVGIGGVHTAANRRTSGRAPSVLALHKTNHMAMLQLSGSVDAQGRPFKKTFAFFDGESCTKTISKGDIWKVQLGKYLKLPLKEAITLGLRLPPELVLAISHKGASDGDEDKDDEADSDDEMEEVTGYHFMDCVPLFVSYVYVNSASKVLEDRLVNRGLQVEFPDFEAVYHLVIDSVDSYNEAWERSFKEQEQMKIDQANGLISASSGGVEAKRKVFMTDKEKKEQLILKQRAELALKKGTAELPADIERRIELEVLQALEAELSKLLAEEQQDFCRSGKFFAAAEVSRSQFATQGRLNVVSSNSASAISTAAQTPMEKKASKRLSVTRYSDGKNTYDSTQMNIDDLFDIFLSPDANQQLHAEYSDDGSDADANREEIPDNEFAAELLYIMRTAVAV